MSDKNQKPARSAKNDLLSLAFTAATGLVGAAGGYLLSGTPEMVVQGGAVGLGVGAVGYAINKFIL